ncbi:hypothetical protein L9F63_004811, partial [Diploptera punctata]
EMSTGVHSKCRPRWADNQVGISCHYLVRWQRKNGNITLKKSGSLNLLLPEGPPDA